MIKQESLIKSIDLDHKLVVSNYNDLANILRVLTLKSYPKLLYKYQDKEDDFFMNPLVFAFFNNDKIEKSEDLLEKILNNEYTQTPMLHKQINYYKAKPEILNEFYQETYRGHVVNRTPDFEVNLDKISKAQKALDVIENHLPDSYQQISYSNKSVFFHTNNKVINFVTKSFQGFLSFWVADEVTELYFIEEFLHQGAHNYLNLYLHRTELFFKHNPEEIPMSKISVNRADYRSFMSAFHGLYTVAVRLIGFRQLLESNIYKGRLKHELLGRYADELARIRDLGIYNIDTKKLLTPKGEKLYKSLVKVGRSYYNKDEYLLTLFDMSDRDIDFYYSQFCIKNSYQNFTKNLEQKINFNN